MQDPSIEPHPPAPAHRPRRRPGSPRPPAHLSLGDGDAYRRWRDRKLAGYPLDAARIRVTVGDPSNLRDDERRRLLEHCAALNMAFYATDPAREATREAIRAFGECLGLGPPDRGPDGAAEDMAEIRVAAGDPAGEYIPYTSRPLNWHTDGYYNPPGRPVRGVVMHCVRPAARGGESRFLDHEIAYILLRDENPDYVAALMQPDAMTIPANTDPARRPRPARSGPVFSVDPRSGRLHMRYTARRRSIVWKPGAAAEAAECLLALIEAASRHTVGVRLGAGEGVVCNNVLHARSAFDEDAGPGRLLWRARYRRRVADVTAPGAGRC